MPGIFPISIKAAFLILVLFQSFILLLRFPTCNSKGELGGFLSILLCLGLHQLLEPFPVQELSAFALVWSFGSYLSLIADQKRFRSWQWSFVALYLVIFSLRVLGFYGTLSFSLLVCFSLELLSVYPLWILWNCYQAGRSGLFLFLLLVVGFLSLSLGYDLLGSAAALPALRTTLWLSFLYLGGTGYMLIQENYLKDTGWQGLYSRLELQEQRLKNAYSRLIQTENTLLEQDRLIASGLLATGAAHEFKNILSTIKTSADFGLARRKVSLKNQSLRMVLEQAEFGRRAVLEFLEQFAGREARESIDIREDLHFLLDMVRATYRREGIQLQVELEPGLRISAGRGELEQIC